MHVMAQEISPSLTSLEADDLAGLYISVILSTCLYTISCAQIFVYWRSGFKDGHLMHAFVSNHSCLTEPPHSYYTASDWFSVVMMLMKVLLINALINFMNTRALETLHSIFFWIYHYHIVVTRYGYIEAIGLPFWAMNYSLVLHGAITACVQVGDRHITYFKSDLEWY